MLRIQWMKNCVLMVAVALSALGAVRAAAPVNLSEVAPVADLVAEAGAKLQLLEEQLKDEAAFLAAKTKVPQAAGVLACMAQAITEHPARDEVQIAAADLRDAALKLKGSTGYQDAVAALASAKSAFAGQASGSAAAEHPWNKLIGLHALMEEVNARNGQIRRAVRRLSDPQTDSLHATTLAVLAVAIHADTHEVKNEADIPKWQQHSVEFQQQMTRLAEAMKQKNTDGAREIWLEGVKSCNACHEDFRKEE